MLNPINSQYRPVMRCYILPQNIRNCSINNLQYTGNTDEISKSYSKISSNNFNAAQLLQKTANISFTGQRITEIPSDWHYSESYNCIMTEGGFIDKYNSSSKAPNPEVVQEYVTTHPEETFPLHEKTYLYTSYGSFDHFGSCDIGALYFEKNGDVTYYSNDEISDILKNDPEFKKPKKREYSFYQSYYPQNQKKEDYSSGFSICERAIIGLINDNRIDDALKLSLKAEKPINKYVSGKLSDILISRGLDDEALERFPERVDYITEKINNIEYYYNHDKNTPKQITVNDFLAKGDLLGAAEFDKESMPKPFDELDNSRLEDISDYINDGELLEKVSKERQKIKQHIQKTDYEYDTPIYARILFAYMTLGASELLNLAGKTYTTAQNIKYKNNTTAKERNLTALALYYMLEAKEKQIDEKKADNYTIRNIEQAKEPAKQILMQRFLNPLNAASQGKPVDLPNCIMLTGENPYVLKGLIDWAGKVAAKNVDYVKLQSKSDKAEMRENLYKALEAAEENYKNTGRRSIIFVNGLDKLIDRKTNSGAEISIMKDFMSSASEDFHSTIIFYTVDNPDNLAPGPLVSHRVGLKINVPVAFNGKKEI